MIIRDVFTAKPGQAGKLAALFKKVMANQRSVRILTDFIGDFNTVEMEFEVKDLAEFEQMMKQYSSGELMKGLDPETAAAMSKYSDMYITGRREVLKVV